MAKPTSIAERLLHRLEEITKEMDVLLDASSIVDTRARNMDLLSQNMFVMLPDAQWGDLDDTQRAAQRMLLELWAPWIEQLNLVLASDTEQRRKEAAGAAKHVRDWIERDNLRDWSVPKSIEEAKTKFREHTKPFVDALRSLSARPATTIVVPDTNVALRSQDLTRWAEVVGTDAFTVVIVPGVLKEIDEAKVHRNDKLQEKARKLNSRIKGWRNQGNIARGVKVEGKVMVRIDGVEPRIEKSLSSLDKNIIDDRIIASVLELQRREPSAPVILLTGDIVMLAKADSALIPTADTPEADL